MNEKLKFLLAFLDDTLDQGHQQKIEEMHQKALNWETTPRLPLVVTYPFPDNQILKPFPHREIFDNPEKMLFNELVHAFDTSIFLHKQVNDDLPYTIRANFGTVIIASLFGACIEQRDDNPPWVRHFENINDFMAIFDNDPLDFSRGWCPKVTERYRFYQDVLNDFTNLKKCVRLVLPDLQGPLDTLELLRGSAVYEDFILDPEMVDEGLSLLVRAQTGFARHLSQFLNDGPHGYAHQHATCIKGNILIRNDSAIMISPEMYTAQVAPHDETLLRELKGGGIHSCGKIDFNIPEIFQVKSIMCFDFGQSYLNDLDTVYPLALEKKIPLVRIRVEREELLSGAISSRFPTGISLVYDAPSFHDAVETVNAYKRIFG